MPECVLCITCEEDELRFGKLITKDGISVHTYCLYLSSNLVQKGNIQDEFYGFLKTDIILERARARKLICYHCKLRGASIGCCATKCSRSFHLPCAINHGTINQFLDEYKSFCSRHLPKIRACPPENQKCDICFEDLVDICGFNPATMIYSQCCHKGWFHKYCLQQYANSAGYFFKCPLCNNKTDFLKVKLWGIFVPNCDAAWETETNAFLELSERESHCVASVCNNGTGRNASPLSLIFCTFCGSNPRHINCVENIDENICSVCGLIKTKLAYEVLNTEEKPHKIGKVKFKSDDSSNDNDHQVENYDFKDKIHSKIEQKQRNGENSRNNLKNTLTSPHEFKSAIFNYEAVCTSNFLQLDNIYNDDEISCIANRVQKRRIKFSKLPNILNDNISSNAEDFNNTKAKNAISYQRGPILSNSKSASLVIIDEVACTNKFQSDKNYNGGETSCIANRVRKRRCNTTKGSNAVYGNNYSIANNTKIKNNYCYRIGPELSKSEPVPFVSTDKAVSTINDFLSNENHDDTETSCIANRVRKRRSNSTKLPNILNDRIKSISKKNSTRSKNYIFYHRGPSCTNSESASLVIIGDDVCTNNNLESDNNYNSGKTSCIANRVKNRCCKSIKMLNTLNMNVTYIATNKTMSKNLLYSNDSCDNSHGSLENMAYYTNKIHSQIELKQSYIDDSRCNIQNVTERKPLSHSGKTLIPEINEFTNTENNVLQANDNCNDNDDPLGNWAYYKNKVDVKIEQDQHGIENLRHKSMNAKKYKPLKLSSSRESLSPMNDKVNSTAKCIFNYNDSCNDSDDPLENWVYYKNKTRKVNIKTEHSVA